ncbi:MAG: type II CRISPR RNA-guided endonuclease Cas9 [Verrucomicrobiota bacterium]
MKEYILQGKTPPDKSTFFSGLVFGFDVGTGSIGYAVRKGAEFKDVGVLICDSEGSELSDRRNLRRQRRTLRSRKYRRQWFAKELIKLGLPKPEQPPNDPISLRLRAINGEPLKPEELHAALAHLFKRRGYGKVPWANLEKVAKETGKPKKDDEEGKIKEAVKEIKEKLAGKHPCQFLAEEQVRVGKSPISNWARKIYWPREVLRDEFLAIAKAQKGNFPELLRKADWLLYGDSQLKKKGGESFHVFFKTTEARNPGVLGLRWPRFDNRGPALDSLRPVDEDGRPLHVVRKNKQAFTGAQWELALMNFRVLDCETRQKLDPRIHFPVFIENLRNEWNKKGKVTEARLKKLAEPFAGKFLLIEDQKPLTPESGTGRARYSSPTLAIIKKEISEGRRVDPPQPILQRKGESVEDALNRYLADIKHPLVRHRLVLFRRLLKQLVLKHGQPEMIVLEAVRSLALGQKAKNELNKRNEQFRKEREIAREQLSSNKESFSRKAIQRYRLWQEAKGRCPFCLQTIERTDLGHGADIEHLVPRAVVDCNEFHNLTVAHIKCNRELKGERTPFAAFAGTSNWPHIKDHAERTFSGRKLEIFLSPNAEELIEQKSDLQHTAYIARVIRHISLVQLGWLNDAGRDPTPDKQNPALSFQVTNGQLTSRLRKAWGLNQILHPLPAGKRWDELTDEEQQQFTEKNRGDLRHHALDAMVIACTLPWLAHRTHGAKDALGRHGWWTQDEKQRSKASNPLFPNEGQMHQVVKKAIEKVVPKHHESRSNHKRTYATTVYGKIAPDIYVSREKLIDLKQTDFRDFHPKDLGAYFDAAWDRFKSETPAIEALLKKTNNKLPSVFVEKMCFSHFQKWRHEKAPTFFWPDRVKIPIRSVKLIAPVNDNSVLRFAQGTPGFVKRTTFKEVHVYPKADGKGFVPVFIPYWRGDKPLGMAEVLPGSKPVTILRKRSIIKTVKPLSTGHPPGYYCLYELGQVQPYLLPPHIAKKEEAIASFGIKKSGIKPRWPDLIKALGYELPHPPSIKPQSQSPHQA